MKFASLAVIGGLASLASADLAKRNYWQSVECTGPNAVTVTVTETAGSHVGGAAATPAPSKPSPYVTTNNGMITSVDYSTRTAYTSCPSAGVYPNPAKGGKSLTVEKPTMLTVSSHSRFCPPVHQKRSPWLTPQPPFSSTKSPTPPSTPTPPAPPPARRKPRAPCTKAKWSSACLSSSSPSRSRTARRPR